MDPKPMTTTGTLVDPQTIRFDAPLPANGEAVRVTVTVTVGVRPQPLDGPELLKLMEKIWEEQRQRGYVPMTKEQIDAYLREERESWGDRWAGSTSTPQ